MAQLRTHTSSPHQSISANADEALQVERQKTRRVRFKRGGLSFPPLSSISCINMSQTAVVLVLDDKKCVFCVKRLANAAIATATRVARPSQSYAPLSDPIGSW